MKKLKSIGLLVVLIMIASLIMPTLTSIAALSGDHTVLFYDTYYAGSTEVGVNLSGEQVINENTNIHLDNFNPATMRAYISAADGFETDLVVNEQGNTNIGTANANSVPNGQALTFQIVLKPANLSVSFAGQAGKIWYKMDNGNEIEVSSNQQGIVLGGEMLSIRGENRTIGNLSLNIDGTNVNIDKEAFKTNGVGNINVFGKANVQLNVEYTDNGGQQTGGPDNIQFDVEFTGTNYVAWINNKQYMDDRDGLVNKYNGTVTGAGFKDQTKTNVLKFQPSFLEKPVTKFIINNVEYTKNSREVQVKENDLWEITVPGAEKYTIRGEGDQNAVTPLTIIWTNPDWVAESEADAQWAKDFKIDHGYAKAIEVYDKNGNKLNPADYINSNVHPDGTRSDEYGLTNGFGWVKVMPGSKVVFEFVPEYGYQLTGISINEQPIEASNVMNRFEFTMPEGSGNVHFAATFTKTADIVKTGTDKISEGSVSLGDNVLNGGSAQITLKDIELSADKIKGFEDKAGDYKISNYLDIDLYQVFFKGKDDSNDVWSNKIDELDNEVTITIKLADGVNGNEIVLVHNIHDGDEYEIIPTTYDPETNTITFKTKSFSGYAIAAKDIAKGTISPKTGDNVAIYVVVFALAGIGLVTTVSNIKKS